MNGSYIVGTATIEIKVVDVRGNLLPRVKIYLDDGLVGYSNRSGCLTFEMEVGNHTISALQGIRWSTDLDLNVMNDTDLGTIFITIPDKEGKEDDTIDLSKMIMIIVFITLSLLIILLITRKFVWRDHYLPQDMPPDGSDNKGYRADSIGFNMTGNDKME